MLTQIRLESHDASWANNNIEYSLELQDLRSNYPKCNKPCPKCPWATNILDKTSSVPTFGVDESAMKTQMGDAFRANPEAVWFCHNTVIHGSPTLGNGKHIPGGVIPGKTPTVCGGFLAWRAKQNDIDKNSLLESENTFVDPPTR